MHRPRQNELHIGVIQSDIYWHDKSANIAMFEEKIWQLSKPLDIILLPEMFNTGFSMDVKAMADPMNGIGFRWMKQMARQMDVLLLGTIITTEGNKFYNRLFWVEPDGSFDIYDKRHLFRMGDEHLTYTAGTTRLVKEYKGWRICPLTCYDLRFPVWSRNHNSSNPDKLTYDLLIYLANWPKTRSSVWDVLLKARALENLAYVAGVNRTGKDGTGIEYNGHSNIYDFKGKEAWSTREDEFIDKVSLNLSDLQDFQKNFPVHFDADDFNIIP